MILTTFGLIIVVIFLGVRITLLERKIDALTHQEMRKP